MFSEHSSVELRNLFIEMPFQGRHPSQARIIFFGRDANYPEDIENNDRRPGCYDLLRQYHKDGVGFWQNAYGNNPTQKHHPFLICMRHGDPGFKYHNVFSRMYSPPVDRNNISSWIDLRPHYETHISFVELLNVPTMGDPKDDPKNAAFDKLIEKSEDYLKWLLQQISSGDFRRVVFMPDCVIKEMTKIAIAPFFYQQIFMRNEPLKTNCPKLIFRYRNIDVYKCYHFSDARGGGQLENMKGIINDYI